MPLVAWCIDSGLVTIATRFDEIFANFPNRLVAGLLRLIVQPLGPRRRGPIRHLTRACATFLLEPSATRERLTVDLFFHPKDAGGLARLENAFKLASVTQPLRDRLNKAHVLDIDQALKQNLINGNEATQLGETAQAVAIAIAVDDFTAEELTHHDADHAQGDRPSPAPEATPASSSRVSDRPVYIIDGSRTPFLKARGIGPFTPVDLAVQCGRPLLLRQPFARNAFDKVILGCVNVIADEMNPARVAALRLGMGEAMTAFTVQINCGSGMQSIETGYRDIQDGVSDLILAGGAEALSYAPLVFRRTAVEWYLNLVFSPQCLVAPEGVRRHQA